MVPAHWFQGLQKGAPQALILYMGAEKHFFTLRCDQQTKVLAIKMHKSNQVNDSFRSGGLYKRFPKSDPILGAYRRSDAPYSEGVFYFCMQLPC